MAGAGLFVALKCRFRGRCSTLWRLECRFCGRRKTLWTLKCRFRGRCSTLSFVDLEVQISWQVRYFVAVELQKDRKIN